MLAQRESSSRLCSLERCGPLVLAAWTPPTGAFFRTEAARLLAGRFAEVRSVEAQVERAAGAPLALFCKANASRVLLIGGGNGGLALSLGLGGCAVSVAEPIPALATALEQSAFRSGVQSRVRVHRVAIAHTAAASSPFAFSRGGSLLRAHRRSCASCRQLARCVDGGDDGGDDASPTRLVATFAQVATLKQLSRHVLAPHLLLLDAGGDNEAIIEGSKDLLRVGGAGRWRPSAILVWTASAPRNGSAARPCVRCITPDRPRELLAALGWACRWERSSLHSCSRAAALQCRFP